MALSFILISRTLLNCSTSIYRSRILHNPSSVFDIWTIASFPVFTPILLYDSFRLCTRQDMSTLSWAPIVSNKIVFGEFILRPYLFFVKPDSLSQDFTGRGMVGNSVVCCRQCGRVWSSVVAWFVVACLRSPLSFEMFKTSRRPSATKIFVSTVSIGQL